MVAFNFNAANVDPSDNFEPMPAGDYLVVASSSEMRNTKDNTGKYLSFEFDVIDGPMSGRKLFGRFNVVNANPKAVEIAQRQFSQLCHAAGTLNVEDTSQLHNRPVVAKVTYREASGGYGPSNDIKGFSPANAGGHQAQAAPAQTQPAWNGGTAAPQTQGYQQPTAATQPAATQQPQQPAGKAPWAR